MSRPKGSKNKAKINMEGVRNYQQPLQNPSYEKIKSEALGAPVSQASLESSILPQWISDVELWCKEKGFHPSELIEKFEELDRKACNVGILWPQGVTKDVSPALEWQYDVTKDQNKPQISPETGLPVNPPKNQKKAKDGAKKGLKIEYDGEPLTDEEIIQLALNAKNHKTKTAELSPFLKSRQALKNGQK